MPVYLRVPSLTRRWMTQKAFEVAVSAAPEWDSIRPCLAPSVDDFHEDVLHFVSASEDLIARVNKALKELDLVDVRKCM